MAPRQSPAASNAPRLSRVLSLQDIIACVGARSTGRMRSAVQDGILAADAFVVFGSAKYGEDTGNAACTYYESKFAQGQKKKIILIRMNHHASSDH